MKVRKARVKGDHQITKDIDKTCFHNASFNNPDTKNNLTVSVTVKGQALTRKNNPVNRQSSKSSGTTVGSCGHRFNMAADES